jgi:endonuclease-3
MPRENKEARTARSNLIVEALKTAYPDAHCELNYRNPLQLMVATILSAQSTDKQVNIVTADLFKKYRSAEDFARVPIPELENDLRRIGLFRNKAKSIQGACQQLLAKHNGQVPRTMAELIQLPGVGRKTANVILGNAFNTNEGVVVDTHVARLSQRLGLSKETQPEKIEVALQAIVPREDWTMFSHWLIWHGRRRCFARGPQCADCEIRELCPSRKLFSRTTGGATAGRKGGRAVAKGRSLQG